MIKVDPGAQQTDAFQESRNLLLSPEAHADAIPGLEILADDVRCTHAAAIAQVDKEQLFYLTSRGLDPAGAKTPDHRRLPRVPGRTAGRGPGAGRDLGRARAAPGRDPLGPPGQRLADERRQGNFTAAVRPGRDNIAAPDLPDGLAWVGAEPESMPALTAGGPALVHFVDLTQLNSVRTLPYLREWEQRYREAGLSVVAVQSPRFPFGADPEAVAAAVAALGIEFPVAIDAEHDLWAAYGCEGWPSLFLWSLGGALSWVHFGEGEYRASEEAIQEELREIDALRELPEPMAPVRPSDAPGATVIAPTPELFPGGSWERAWTASEDEPALALDYQAGGVYATVEGEGEIAVEIDGEWAPAVAVGPAPALQAIAEHPSHEAHSLLLRPSPGLRVWSVSFAAGTP